MRVPVSWLGDWVDLPEDLSLQSLHAALVRVGFEEEDVARFDVHGPIVVGRVLSVEAEPQSNGKTINWCQVDVGEVEPRGIVCGAHNFTAGDAVVVTLPGAVLPGPTASEPFVISARKTYGHVSDGMIASARELGYGDEHDGILRLADLGIDAPVGSDAIALLGLNDAAVEVNVTPDRGYALSIRGIAREYALSTGAAFRDPADAVALPETAPAGFSFRFSDDAPLRGREGAAVGAFRIVRGVDGTRPTPPWMRSRLLLAGIRSVSLLVDVTNYVMIELGQPIHGFDLGRVRGGITIRRAAAGESIRTLDGKLRPLDPEDMVVADDSGPLALGGVMGGAATELSRESTEVLIESFCWEPVSVSRSSRRHKLFSEASRRLERGVDPALAPIAAQRVLDLLVDLAGGTADAVGAHLGTAPAPRRLTLEIGRPTALTGVDYTDDEVIGALTAIGADVIRDGDVLRVTPPSWRPDLVDDAGLVEEVVRVTGYHRIPSVLPVAPPGRGYTVEQRARRRVADALAASGLTEVLGAVFQSAEAVQRFSRGASAFRLQNPLDPREPELRLSLLPGLVATAQRNLARGLTDLALFEVGRVFGDGVAGEHGTDDLPLGGVRLDAATIQRLIDSVPTQPWRVGALILGDAVPAQPGRPALAAGLADALDVAREVAWATGARIRFRAGAHPALHPGRGAEAMVGERVVGVVGELLPALAAELDLPRVVALAELDLDALIELGARQVSALPIGTFPAATQDVSLVVGVEVPAAEVRAAFAEGAGELLEDIRLIDDYRGTGIPPGRRSLTFGLRFRAEGRTLTAAEATAAKLAGVAAAARSTGASLRE